MRELTEFFAWWLEKFMIYEEIGFLFNPDYHYTCFFFGLYKESQNYLKHWSLFTFIELYPIGI